MVIIKILGHPIYFAFCLAQPLIRKEGSASERWKRGRKGGRHTRLHNRGKMSTGEGRKAKGAWARDNPSIPGVQAPLQWPEPWARRSRGCRPLLAGVTCLGLLKAAREPGKKQWARWGGTSQPGRGALLLTYSEARFSALESGNGQADLHSTCARLLINLQFLTTSNNFLGKELLKPGLSVAKIDP